MVQGSVADRLHLRRDAAARPAARTTTLPIRISISAMRVLETSLALGAIATALLIGHH